MTPDLVTIPHDELEALRNVATKARAVCLGLTDGSWIESAAELCLALRAPALRDSRTDDARRP